MYTPRWPSGWPGASPDTMASSIATPLEQQFAAIQGLDQMTSTSGLGATSITTVATSPAHPFNVRQFLSYVWQFYLPRLPFLTPFRTTPQLPVYDIWVHQVAGVFGWLEARS